MGTGGVDETGAGVVVTAIGATVAVGAGFGFEVDGDVTNALVGLGGLTGAAVVVTTGTVTGAGLVTTTVTGAGVVVVTTGAETGEFVLAARVGLLVGLFVVVVVVVGLVTTGAGAVTTTGAEGATTGAGTTGDMAVGFSVGLEDIVGVDLVGINEGETVGDVGLELGKEVVDFVGDFVGRMVGIGVRDEDFVGGDIVGFLMVYSKIYPWEKLMVVSCW